MNNPRPLAVICLITMLSVSSSGIAGDKNKEKAKALFEKGVEQMEAGRYDDACPDIAESYRLDPYPGTLFALAECEAKRGHIATAVKHYDEYLMVYDALSPDKKFKQGTRQKDSLAQKAALGPLVPELTLMIPPSAPRATVVRFDGTEIAAASLGVALSVDPGQHIVTTQAPGGLATERRVVISQGEKKSLMVEVSLSPPVEGPAPVPVQPERRSMVPAVVMGGIGVVGVGVGIVTLAMHATDASVANRLSNEIKQDHGHCYPGVAGQDKRCEDLRLVSMAGDANGTASIVGFAIGGAAAIGTATYLLWPMRRPSTAAIHVVPTVGRGSGGLLASGNF